MTLKTRDSRHADVDALFSRRARQVGTEPLLQGMDGVGQRISFIFGFPDPASLPADEVAAVTTRVLGERGQAALQYGDNAGYSGLIDALLAKLARDQGIRARRENVLITAGGSQAIDLLLDALVDWGDTIVSEMPTWLGAVQAFRNVGANIVSIPVDEEGIDVTALRAGAKPAPRSGHDPEVHLRQRELPESHRGDYVPRAPSGPARAHSCREHAAHRRRRLL